MTSRRPSPRFQRSRERLKGTAQKLAHTLHEAWRDLKAGVASFKPRNLGINSRPVGAVARSTPGDEKNEDQSTAEIIASRIKAREAQGLSPSDAMSKPAALMKPDAAGDSSQQTTGRRPRPIGLASDLAGLAVSLGVLALSGGLAFVFLFVAPEPPNKADLWSVNRLPSVVVLDRDGEELAARGARYGEQAKIEDLPPYLIKAFLATEDRRFYDHHGVDLKGVLRAFITNLREGGIAEGGSTITQQLAKNLFFSSEQTYVRKAKEALLAMWLEGHYTKEEILSFYLNRIYMGAGAYGVESAARTYFDKPAKDVSLAEAVMLAGLPQAPSALAPTSNPFGAQDRAWEVLENLRETGYITDFDARQARLSPPVITPRNANGDIGYFFDYVAEAARAIVGPINDGGPIDIVVHTTLDRESQRSAEAAVATIINDEAKAIGADQAALMAYDNATGALIAMVGGRSYVESQFNRATQAKRQPGSAFKPIVFAAALENGMTPKTRIVDQPIDIAGWKPRNYVDRYDGPMRLTEAMARSINTVAVQVSEQIGRDKVINMARRLGVNAKIPEAEAGIALGAFNATLQELTAAYLPFARSGQGVKPYAITSIEDGRGNVLYTHQFASHEQIFKRRLAQDVTHLMYQVTHDPRGTGKRASLGRRPAVGKTGTTNDWRDAWFIGYTAQLTAGVWVGNDDYKPMDKVTGGALPAEIWKTFMNAAHQDLDIQRIAGAYPSPNFADENELLQFYTAAMRDFQRVQRDGNARRFQRRSSSEPGRPFFRRR